jgi:exodeoxyribonuclease V alpha subunit
MITKSALIKVLAYRKLTSAMELEFARFLHSLDRTANLNELVAGMAVIHHLQKGSIAIDADDFSAFPLTKALNLTNDDFPASTESKIIGNPGAKTPLILSRGMLYTQKNWKYEHELITWILQKTKQKNSISSKDWQLVDTLFGETGNEPEFQKIAVKLALFQSFLVISGGPGTGKTYTVKKILEIFTQREDKHFKIELAAPTGKAAQRLTDTIREEEQFHDFPKAQTVHALLQANGDGNKFGRNTKNKLDLDILIVDEASMLDLNLWVAIIRALPEDARLIVLGDRHQLASVEAGSILGDICGPVTNSFSVDVAKQIEEPIKTNHSHTLGDHIVTLTKTHRFNGQGGIQRLSEAIKNGTTREVMDILNDSSTPEVQFRESYSMQNVFESYINIPFQSWRSSPNPFEKLNNIRVLHAMRVGDKGEQNWNRMAEMYVKSRNGIGSTSAWYDGRPVLIIQNNRMLGLRNGEVGIYSSKKGGILFENNELIVEPSRLPAFQSGYSLTIHKSQGSEYEEVIIVLPDEKNAVLSKELLYTAVTRARRSVLILSSIEIITYCIENTTTRKSGLKYFLG